MMHNAQPSTVQYELKTEAPNSKHENLDAYATPQLIQAIVEDQINAVRPLRLHNLILAAR